MKPGENTRPKRSERTYGNARSISHGFFFASSRPVHLGLYLIGGDLGANLDSVLPAVTSLPIRGSS